MREAAGGKLTGMADEEDDRDPLDWLEPKQQQIVAGVIEILEATLGDDKDLIDRVVGGMLAEIDEWGLEREALREAPTDGKPN